MDKNIGERRWDNDERGHGVGDGTAFAPHVQQFLDALHIPSWVAEDPDIHLLPHLHHACDLPDSAWRIVATAFADSIYTVRLEWLRPEGNITRLRADVFALVGTIAEGATYVHQQVTNDGMMYKVITGLLDDQTPFRGHGHLVRLLVSGERAALIAAASNRAVP